VWPIKGSSRCKHYLATLFFEQEECRVVKLYKSETKRVVNRFLLRQLSFPKCIAALDAALARLVPRLRPEDLEDLRSLMLANNERVMKEMERRAASK